VLNKRFSTKAIPSQIKTSYNKIVKCALCQAGHGGQRRCSKEEKKNMAKNSGSVQSAQALLVSLLYAKICHDWEEQRLIIGPGGLTDENSSRRMLNDADQLRKIQIGPGGLSQGNSQNNPLPDEAFKKIALALVDEHDFAQKVMAAFDEGQEKDEGKFAA